MYYHSYGSLSSKRCIWLGKSANRSQMTCPKWQVILMLVAKLGHYRNDYGLKLRNSVLPGPKPKTTLSSLHSLSIKIGLQEENVDHRRTSMNHFDVLR